MSHQRDLKSRAGGTEKVTAFRRSKHDHSSACKPGSVPTLPPLTCHSFTAGPPPRPQLPQPGNLSVVELPRLVAKVGTELALEESMWTEGPCLMASALAADIPFKVVEHHPEITSNSTVGVYEDVEKYSESDGLKVGKESRTEKSVRGPLTSFEVFEIFAKKRHLGELQFYHLKPSEEGSYRPYHLHVVPPGKAGSDHYVFSPTSVLQVQGGQSAGLLTLAGWYHEAVLWNALRDIPFFRDYLPRKIFRRWRRNVCQVLFQRKRELLQSQLLVAVPQFRDALLHFKRLLEELKKVDWLPQDESRTYTLPEFQSALLKSNQQSSGILEKFLHYRRLILTLVQERSFSAWRESQLRLEEAQLKRYSESRGSQQASIHSFYQELNQAERVLQRLGNFAALADCICIQSLVTIMGCEVTTFLNKVLKRQQGSLFQAELIFGSDGQLTLTPSLQLIQEELIRALSSITDSVLQVFDSCNNDSLATNFTPISDFKDLTSNTGLALNISIGVKRASKDRRIGQTSVENFASEKNPRVASAPNLVQSTMPSLRVQGQRLQGQYCPLSKRPLKWYLHLHAARQEIEQEPARIIQEALHEIQQWCKRHSWLIDTHLFTSQWGPASVENMREWPTPKYEEHIQKIRWWRDEICKMTPAFTTSNKLLIVNCSHIQEKLGLMLKSIEEDVSELLTEELQLRSESWISELKKAVESLKTEPTDLCDFTNYAGMVKHYKIFLVHMQQKMEHIWSLHKIIQLNDEKNMFPGETLKEQTHGLWNQLVKVLKEAEEKVTQKLPSMTTILDNNVGSLTKKVEVLVSSATNGPYLDPNQSASHMVAKLKTVCGELHVTVERLNELSRSNNCLRDHPLDLKFVMTSKEKVEARKELWELLSDSTRQVQEWRVFRFHKFVASRAQERVNEWLQQAASLTKIIPSDDAVLQETLNILETFSQQLPLLSTLSSPTLKHKHWRRILKILGLLNASDSTPEQNVTVADLISKELWEHQYDISKVYREAKAEADMEQALKRLQQSWENTVFRLSRFIITLWEEENQQVNVKQRKELSVESPQNVPQQHSHDSGTFIIKDLDTLLAQTEDSIMTLTRMLSSPFVAEFRKETEHWVQILQELYELLNLCDRYQQEWVFLSKMCYETSVRTQKLELLETFSPVDKTFRELIQVMLHDPGVLHFVGVQKNGQTKQGCRTPDRQFRGQHLRMILTKGLTVMENISKEFLHLIDSSRVQFPRLCFLSDGEVLKLFTQHPAPSSLLPLVRKCFRGVQWLDVGDNGEYIMPDQTTKPDPCGTQMWVRGVYGALRECVPFLCPLECSLDPLDWFGLLEKRLQQAVKHQIWQCTVDQHLEAEEKDCEPDTPTGSISSPDGACMSSAVRKDKGNISVVTEPLCLLQLISKHPLQCILVAEEVLWCTEIQKTFYNLPQTKWAQIKSQSSVKLQRLSQAIQKRSTNSYEHLASQKTVLALRTLMLLTIKHSQQIAGLTEVKGNLETSFEWQRLFKYRHSSTDNPQNMSLSQKDLKHTEQSVYVDVLGSQLAYGYEYTGPENWVMVNTPSTERAFLGILLALTSYRCAFISGPHMSGKKSTVLQLGWALGQQVVTFGCCAYTSLLIVHRMLLGALQSGAWLVLDSVDSMPQGTLSILGQYLTDIHQYLSTIWKNEQQCTQKHQDHTDNASPNSHDGDFINKHSKKMTEMECKLLFGGKEILAKPNFGCVIISSNGYNAEIPENLRVATRPVSLMQPDYNVIAEVLLVSLGFSEATSMSQRLISLFRLAKDSCCLPDFISRDQTSWLILLRRVIDASGTFLHSNAQRTNKDNLLVPNGKKLVDVTLEEPDKISQESIGGDDHRSSSYESSSQSYIIKAVREEQAVIKGFISVLLPAIFEHKRASQLCTIFKEIFPAARCFPCLNQFTEEREHKILKSAITKELELTGYCADIQMVNNIVSLHQVLKSSKAVVLVGPAGSGKTTTYQTLAGALRQLATKSVETKSKEDFASEKHIASRWCRVDTVVLFPNALSHEELFGRFSEQSRCWRDGALTKMLRDTNRHDFSDDTLSNSDKIVKGKNAQTVKWLVLDGEPLNPSGWFDSLSTLCDTENPFLCLSSGEKVQPSREGLKILVESTSLSDLTPSALTRCSLVYVSEKDLWKAVWKMNMEALNREHDLDRSTLKMWSCLAEDLFAGTLTFLQDEALTTALSCDGHESRKSYFGITDRLQAVMSFNKIIHALLSEFGKRDACPKIGFSEPQAKNFFVVAYIWSFGGQLHPRHWPQFDLYARQALFESRYKIEMPAEGTVFENFFNLHDGDSEVTTSMINLKRNKDVHDLHSFTSVHQYETYAYLLDLMLEAHQPVLLVGELGSGKTMLCKSLLSQERKHIYLSGSSLLHSANLRHTLEKMGRSQKTRLDSFTITEHPGLLLFVDDLHDAHFDTNGKTFMPLDTLRQSISRGGVLTSDSFRFKLFSSEGIRYLGTCIPFGPKKSSYSHISPRLSRLFTTFVLPSMTVDILFSIHSAQLQGWLKNFSFIPGTADTAHCIVAATFDAYLAIYERLPSSACTPHLVFSLHDLQKVFQGMCLWDPRTTERQLLQRNDGFCMETPVSSALPSYSPASFGPAAKILNIAKLWMHECWRTFGDRLCSEEERQKLVSVLMQVSEKNFGSKLEMESQTGEADKLDPACQLKGMITDHPNQQDKDEMITSSKVSELHVWQDEESESSEEQSNTDSSFLSRYSDEEQVTNTFSTRISNEEQSDLRDEFQSESAPPTTTSSPQSLSHSSPKSNVSDISDNKVMQRVTQQHVQNESDVPVCETHQATMKIPLQLLHKMGSSVRNVVFSTELGEPQFKPNLMYQERDLDMLVQRMIQIIQRKEEKDSKAAGFVIYHDRVRQLVRILRALLIPGGHGVLFGAAKKTGRKTTVRLAAYVTGYQLFEVHRGNQDKLKEMLKEARSQTDAHGGRVIFLIHEDISQTVRDELLLDISSGKFLGLYSEEQKILNMNVLLKNSQKQGNRGMRKILDKYFRNRQRNIHIFLLLPLDQSDYNGQTGQSSVIMPHINKFINLCCCVEVYQPWSSEALVEIASLHVMSSKSSFQNLETKFDIKVDDVLVTSVGQVMARIHQSATVYASTFLKMQAFGPETYMELMAYFTHLLDHLCRQGREHGKRLAAVLAHVKEMTDKAEIYSENVLRLKGEADEMEQSLNQLQRAIHIERTVCDQTRQHCLVEERQLSLLEEKLDQAEHQDQNDLQKVSPLYQAALKALQSLNQSDLDEVRRYRHPPDGVVMLMNALCMMFGRPCNWESSKKLLGQPNFLQELIFFDRSNVSSELFQKLSQIVQSPNFQPDSVHGVSRACESLCCWVRAVYECACVQRRSAPQEARKKRLAERMAKCRTRLRNFRLQEEAARKRLEDLERQQQIVRKDLEELSFLLCKTEEEEKEATAAVEQLSFYIAKWKRAEREREMNMQNTFGDALILAATITYLGPFVPGVRLELLEKWHKLCLMGKINIRPEDPRTSLLSGPQCCTVVDPNFAPIPVGMELHRVLAQAFGMEYHVLKGLPPHAVLKLLLWGHRVPWAQHWPLLANTKQRKVLSSKATLMTAWSPDDDDGGSYIEKEFELVISAEDPELLDKLSHGAENGLKVLLTHIERAVPSEEFLNVLVRSAGEHSVGGCHPHPEFCLFLSTPLPVQTLLNDIHPLILERTKVIDLSLNPSEIQSVVMTDLLQSECSELLIHLCQAKMDKHELQEKLQLKEASLMEYILQSSTPLLQDPEFFPRVSECQSISQSLQAKTEELSEEINCHKPLLDEFHCIAGLASDFYKTLQEVARLSHFYNFPLSNFLHTLQEALAPFKGRTDQSSKETISEILYRILLYILPQYRPCIVQSHAELLSLLMSVAFIVRREGCSEIERVTFLKGLGDIDIPECAPSTSELEFPKWIPSHTRGDTSLLEKIPPFHGLVSSLRNSSRQWQEYFCFPSSTVVGPVPCQSHNHLTTLQRAILWKTLFPQWLSAVADDLAACEQGQAVRSAMAGGPHTGSPEELSCFLAKNRGPVIITLPGQSKNGTGDVHPLHWIKQVAQHQEDKKGVMVTVISFGSECHRDDILSALDTAVQNGHWLVFNNCHLLDRWDAKVVTRLTQLMSCTTKDDTDLKADKDLSGLGEGVGGHVHPHFRLWFITISSFPLSVPAVVRTCAVHMACDSHWDLKDDLTSSLRLVLSTVAPATTSRCTEDMVEPLLRCAILHSVLSQRQKLEHLRQGSIYKWTQEDLVALVDAQVHIAKHCNDPTGALEYIAAYLIYGGHVSDSSDLKAVEAVCKVCLQPPTPMWGNGPHRLLETISMTRHFDNQDLLKGLKNVVQSTLNNTDSMVLGFSAEMPCELVKVKSRTLGRQLLQSQGCLAAVRGGSGVLSHLQELPDHKKAHDTLQALQDKMEQWEKGRSMGTENVSSGPLHDFLHREWEHLTEEVSSALEQLFLSSQRPSASTYVTSAIISEWHAQADLLGKYLRDEGQGSPRIYCLSAFANARGFLAALMRETFCMNQADVNHVSMNFQVLDAATSPASMPSSGICLTGLELHGALWDTRLQVLRDTLSPKPCPLPLLWVTAQVKNGNGSRSQDSPPSTSVSGPFYNCPLYLDTQIKDEAQSLSGENIVTHVPLMTRLDPTLCILRGVRLVSTLRGNKCDT